jgi:hypothetical protein
MTNSATASFFRFGYQASKDWFDACHDWCRESDRNLIGQGLVDAIREQWLVTDIRGDGVQAQAQIDPQWANTQKIVISKTINVQVLYAINIGQSAYSQLQTMLKVNNANTRVSADEQIQATLDATQYRQAAWEPKSGRVLKMFLTDGFHKVEAIEHEQINDLDFPMPPGLKIQIVGPVTCRRGVLMLTRRSVRVLGGVVEDMAGEFDMKNLLSNIIGTEDVGQNDVSNETRIVAPRAQPQAGQQNQFEDDDDLFNDIEMPGEPTVPPPPATSTTSCEPPPTSQHQITSPRPNFSNRPFSYLLHLPKETADFCSSYTIKGCITSLASKLTVKEIKEDKKRLHVWHVSVIVTDGSDSRIFSISGKLLSDWIGVNPIEYAKMPAGAKSTVKQSVMAVSTRLMNFNGLIKIERCNGEPVIISMSSPNRGHLQQLRVRMKR